MHCDCDHWSALEPLLDDGWLNEILYEVKSGKEATVFCCRGGARAPGGTDSLIAAKVYRPIESRRFKNDAMYVGGRLHMAREGRAKRAVRAKSSFGREVQYATWLAQEWEVMRRLHAAGVAVPAPLACGERAILMPFLGDERQAAPGLHEISPQRRTAARIIDALLDEIELMLELHCVHGDLSPYNILFHDERPIIIDLPQAVDPRLNQHGYALLARDIDHVCAWAAKHGVQRPAAKIAARLWHRFLTGELG